MMQALWSVRWELAQAALMLAGGLVGMCLLMACLGRR